MLVKKKLTSSLRGLRITDNFIISSKSISTSCINKYKIHLEDLSISNDFYYNLNEVAEHEDDIMNIFKYERIRKRNRESIALKEKSIKL